MGNFQSDEPQKGNFEHTSPDELTPDSSKKPYTYSEELSLQRNIFDLDEDFRSSDTQPPPEAAQPHEIVSYDQQLQYELNLRGWKEEELAKKLDTTVTKVKEWETNPSALEFADRQKLSHLLGIISTSVRKLKLHLMERSYNCVLSKDS